MDSQNTSRVQADQNTNSWPHGMSVIAVDNDISCLKMISTLLRECKYKVTITNQATKALELLRKNMYAYDIVIAEVNMPEMDGLELLRTVGLEMNIPFIMISENDDMETITECVRLGAQDFLVKPIQMKDLKNVWQHALRMKLFHTPQWTRTESSITRTREAGIEDAQSDKALKKPRVRWTKTLSEKFAYIVEKLGNDAVPKKIIELLNEPNLTIAHISSHLQKYRKGLKKGGMKSTKPVQQNLHSNNSTLHPPFLSPLQVGSFNNNDLITPINQPNPNKSNPFIPCHESSPTNIQPWLWNSYNMTSFNSFSNIDSTNVVASSVPNNNHFDGVQTNSLGAGQIQNQENMSKVDIDVETTQAGNAIHVESGGHGETKLVENNNMMHQQEQQENKINTHHISTLTPEEEDNFNKMIEKYMNDLPPLL